MSTERDRPHELDKMVREFLPEFPSILKVLLTSEIVELQLLCDAELQSRADYYPDDDGGVDDGWA